MCYAHNLATKFMWFTSVYLQCPIMLELVHVVPIWTPKQTVLSVTQYPIYTIHDRTLGGGASDVD